MTPERWAEVTRIFGLAIDAEPAERLAVVNAECGGDAELRREVLELLESDAQSGDMLLGLSAAMRDAIATARPATAPGLPIAPGDVLAGRYRVDRVLGAGGMGVVVEATHLGLQERVAIKLLRSNVAANPKLRERFLQEARAVASVKNRHIVRVRDIDIAEDGTPFMVMDLLSGVDLAAVLVQRGRLPIPEATRLILQACEALAVTHGAGLVHRDLKPANLFLEQSDGGAPTLKLLDFGVSKQTLLVEALTKSGDVMGTPAYMSPEQLSSSRDVDGRSDIWSLGVVLYELISGRCPFEGRSDGNLYLNILQRDPAPISELTVPPELELVLRRCLAKDRSQRYATVADLAVELAPFAGSSGFAQAARVARTVGVAAARASQPPIEAALEQLRTTTAAPHTVRSALGATLPMNAELEATQPMPATSPLLGRTMPMHVEAPLPDAVRPPRSDRSRLAFAVIVASLIVAVLTGLAFAASTRRVPAASASSADAAASRSSLPASSAK
ncbi:MAG: serine/threonine-protein kinase [Polyangiaceae bacterium]